jgi:hypothetical protein
MKSSSFEHGVREDPQLFVSYARADAGVVLHDLDLLRAAGVAFWHDERIPVGTPWREELARRIEECSAVISFLSRRSVRSQHCTEELSFAIDRRKPLICVYLEQVALTPGLQMSVGHRQALIRYSLTPSEYRDKLVDAAHRATRPDPNAEPPSTVFLPGTLMLRYGGCTAAVPAGFPGMFTVGRSPDCNVITDSSFISRRHGHFRAVGGAFEYRDTSRNGTLLKAPEGERLIHGEAVELPESGQLMVGDLTIEFECAKCP